MGAGSGSKSLGSVLSDLALPSLVLPWSFILGGRTRIGLGLGLVSWGTGLENGAGPELGLSQILGIECGT